MPDSCLFSALNLPDLSFEAVAFFPDLATPFVHLLLRVRGLALAEETHFEFIHTFLVFFNQKQTLK